jgi:broad specificity phosphatase PhoE
MRNALWRAACALAAACGLAFGLWAGAGIARAQGPDALALMREGGNVLLVRHAATEPGVGDPPAFRLGECGTQRNLSAAGRVEARRLGEALRAHGIRLDQARSSRWCRCLDTARLAFAPHLPVTEWAPLDSFFGDRSAGPAQTRAALAALGDLPADGNWVWVTHQVNISSLAGTPVAMGEVLVARPEAGRLRVLARWRP